MKDAAVLIAAVLAAVIACAPLAQADSGDQASAQEAVTAIYNRVQHYAMNTLCPQYQYLAWASLRQQIAAMQQSTVV